MKRSQISKPAVTIILLFAIALHADSAFSGNAASRVKRKSPVKSAVMFFKDIDRHESGVIYIFIDNHGREKWLEEHDVDPLKSGLCVVKKIPGRPGPTILANDRMKGRLFRLYFRNEIRENEAMEMRPVEVLKKIEPVQGAAGR